MNIHKSCVSHIPIMVTIFHDISPSFPIKLSIIRYHNYIYICTYNSSIISCWCLNSNGWRASMTERSAEAKEMPHSRVVLKILDGFGDGGGK